MLRPLQWSKNLLVLAPLAFARQAGVPEQAGRALLATAAFCLLSSSLYIFNDLRDREEDRRHPVRRRRPIVAGAVDEGTALVAAVLLAAAAFLLGSLLPSPAPLCLLGYAVLGVAYTLVLKHWVIVDVLALSAGFVLRAAAGAFAIQVEVSPWLLVCSMLLALFLAVAKRRHELLVSPSRAVMGSYTPALLDQMTAVVTSSTLMSYVLYAFSDQTTRKFPSGLMPLTVPFVLFGIFRYLFLIYRRGAGGEPESVLFRDRPLLAAVVLWAASVLVIASR